MIYDLIIVGAGPIGLAAACAAQDAGLNFLILDKAGPCQSIVEYAPRQSFYSPAEELEVGGVPFPMAADDKPRREDALAYYRAVITSRKLPLQTWERVASVHKTPDGFTVKTVQQPDAAWTKTYTARFVLIVNGVWDQPRTLDVPGVDLHKVTTHYLDPTPYLGQECLTIGGGNSAAEVAMSLARAGAKSSLALLEPSFDVCNLRPFVLRELLILVEEKKIKVYFETEATSITPTEVCLRHLTDGTSENIPNDFVFILIGQNPDIPFLEDAGITVSPDDHRPLYDEETFETNVPGLYVAGSIARDQHIVNGRPRAVKIVQQIADQLQKL
ncbi:MAG: NAD(P)-binding domain-containing protein [Janthinobacterium lividum]